MLCPKCGTQIPDDSTFCPNCGAQLGAAQPQVQRPAYQQQPQAPSQQYQQKKARGTTAL